MFRYEFYSILAYSVENTYEWNPHLYINMINCKILAIDREFCNGKLDMFIVCVHMCVTRDNDVIYIACLMQGALSKVDKSIIGVARFLCNIK